MKLDAPGFQPTPYGDVDIKALAELRHGYDTTQLLQLVGRLDKWRARFGSEGGLRDEVLRLHAMAHTVLNGGPLTVAPDETDFWEYAQEITEELLEIANDLRQAASLVQPLEALAPDPW